MPHHVHTRYHALYMPTPGTMLYTCPHQAPCSIHAHTRHHALYMPTPGTMLYTCPHRRHRMHIHIRRIICVPDMVPCTTHQTCAAPSTCVGEYHPSTILVPSLPDSAHSAHMQSIYMPHSDIMSDTHELALLTSHVKWRLQDQAPSLMSRTCLAAILSFWSPQ